MNYFETRTAAAFATNGITGDTTAVADWARNTRNAGDYDATGRTTGVVVDTEGQIVCHTKRTRGTATAPAAWYAYPNGELGHLLSLELPAMSKAHGTHLVHIPAYKVCEG